MGFALDAVARYQRGNEKLGKPAESRGGGILSDVDKDGPAGRAAGGLPYVHALPLPSPLPSYLSSVGSSASQFTSKW